jgi:hypothetical protein
MVIVQEELSGPGDTAPSVVSKTPIKMRQSKSRPVSSVQNAAISGGMLPQHLAVYQSTPVSPQPHQFMVQFKMCLILCPTHFILFYKRAKGRVKTGGKEMVTAVK